MIKEEIKEQENQAMIDYLEQLQKEDYEDAIKKKHQQKKLAVN